MFQVWQWPSRIHFIRFHFLNVCKIRPSTFGGGEHEFLFGSPVFFTRLFRKKKVTSLSSIEVVLSKFTKHKASTSWWRCGYGLLYDALKFSKKYIYFDACICDRICFIQVGKKGHKFLGGGGHGTLRTLGTFV